MIRDTYTRLLKASSTQLDLFAAGSKTSQDTLVSDSTQSQQAYENWVTTLKLDYTQRQRSVPLTNEQDCLSSPSWQTPLVPHGGRTIPEGSDPSQTIYTDSGRKVQIDLNAQVKNWGTPRVTTNAGQGNAGRPDASRLEDQAQMWSTPKVTAGDYTNDQGDPDKPRLTLQGQAKNWPTPTVMEPEQKPEILLARAKRMKLKNNGKDGTTYSGNGAGPTLGTAVQMWTTPTTGSSQATQYQQGGSPLMFQVIQEDEMETWPTPATRDYKGMNRDGYEGKGAEFMDQLPNAVRKEQLSSGQPDPESPSEIGKPRGRLNPAWVLQLMGTHLLRTFYVQRVME